MVGPPMASFEQRANGGAAIFGNPYASPELTFGDLDLLDRSTDSVRFFLSAQRQSDSDDKLSRGVPSGAYGSRASSDQRATGPAANATAASQACTVALVCNVRAVTRAAHLAIRPVKQLDVGFADLSSATRSLIASKSLAENLLRIDKAVRENCGAPAWN
jgi:hypothetical protein